MQSDCLVITDHSQAAGHASRMSELRLAKPDEGPSFSRAHSLGGH